MLEFMWIDLSTTDPDDGMAQLNAAGAAGWTFGWVSPAVSAHTRIWMQRTAAAKEEAEAAKAEAEAEAAKAAKKAA
jgi:hypothetical protein